METVIGMSNAEFHVLRERLGLDAPQVAAVLGVQERAVLRWDDEHRIPQAIEAWLRSVASKTAELVAGEVVRIRNEGIEVVPTYRTDDGFHADYPDSPFSASWHRAWIGRVAREIPNLRIEFKD